MLIYNNDGLNLQNSLSTYFVVELVNQSPRVCPSGASGRDSAAEGPWWPTAVLQHIALNFDVNERSWALSRRFTLSFIPGHYMRPTLNWYPTF